MHLIRYETSTYKGGMQRVRRVKRDITFVKLNEISLVGSSWDTSIENIRIEYLHHNGQTYSLICIKNDDDISCMFDLSGNNLNAIYLYIHREDSNVKDSRYN